MGMYVYLESYTYSHQYKIGRQLSAIVLARLLLRDLTKSGNNAHVTCVQTYDWLRVVLFTTRPIVNPSRDRDLIGWRQKGKGY
jgi:hypothetical protein